MSFLEPFSLPVLTEVVENGEELADNLCEAAYQLRENDPNGKLISEAWHDKRRAKSPEDYDKFGYTSHGAYRLINDPRFNDLHKTVVKQVEKYTNYCGSDPSFYLTNSWVSIYGRGHYAAEHIHGLSHLACVFYGATTEGTGELVLRNPGFPAYGMVYGSGVALFNDRYQIRPKKGMMVIFPAHVAHYTNPHMADEDRIIFSCNAVFDESAFSGRH